jgi:hypothetical protein
MSRILRTETARGRLRAGWLKLGCRKLTTLTESGGAPDLEKMHQFDVWFACFAP